ncbi:MAG: methyltransferase domain-containing protein [Chloroflexota bacterium]
MGAEATQGGSAADRWDRPDLVTALRQVLADTGLDRGPVTVDQLAPLDQFHAGGIGFTRRLAALGGLAAGMQVLDVGGGLGGPARTIAAELGCRVTVVDLAPSYVEAGRLLTSLAGLEDRVAFRIGDALALDVPDASVDVVWTQNSGMSIADKARLYAGFRRVLRPGGRLVTQEPMAGPGGPTILPTMWAVPDDDQLRPPAVMRATTRRPGSGSSRGRRSCRRRSSMRRRPSGPCRGS